MGNRRQKRSTPKRSSKKPAALTPVPPPGTPSPSAGGLAPPPRQQDPESQAQKVSDFQKPKQSSSIARLDWELLALKRKTELEAAHKGLRDVEQNAALPPEERLIQQRYWERQCETAKLRLELFHLPGQIKCLENQSAFESSPAGQERHAKRLRSLWAGRALGSGGGIRWELTRDPENPANKAKRALHEAEMKYRNKQRQLQLLDAEDPHWKELYQASLQRTAPPPSPADESPANQRKPKLESEGDARADQGIPPPASSAQTPAQSEGGTKPNENKRGRPPRDASKKAEEAAEVRELKEQRKSWPQIARELNRRHGTAFTPGRYRKLL